MSSRAKQLAAAGVERASMRNPLRDDPEELEKHHEPIFEDFTAVGSVLWLRDLALFLPWLTCFKHSLTLSSS